MDVVLHALFGLLTGAARGPRMDPVVAVAAMALGLLTGLFMYRSLFDNGSLGLLAWVLIPMAATVIVATVLGRPDSLRGGLLAAGVALFVGLPVAVIDAVFSLWA